MENYICDINRYGNNATIYIKLLMYTFRKAQSSKTTKKVWSLLFGLLAKKNHLEISTNTQIGAGLYIGHPFCITINPKAILGKNINIHKGVTIGQTNRGKRKGVPTIGNNVWIGINSTIVGNITIGDDVLIAPNSYVNCDVPSHVLC